jgi:hypothetical protein
METVNGPQHLPFLRRPVRGGKLSAGGQQGRCAWLKDKFGVSWQIAPTALVELMQAKDATKSARVMRAMLQMTKIEIASLQRAYEGTGE